MADFKKKTFPIVAFVDDGSDNQGAGLLVGGLPTSGNYVALQSALVGAGGLNVTSREPDDAIDSRTPEALDVNGYNQLYNPVTDDWNRQRGNHAINLLGSAARTANTTTGNQINYNARGLHIITNITAVSGAASITVTIQGWDESADIWYDILIGTANAAIGREVLKVYPGIGEVPNGAASDILPYQWRVSIAHATADSITYSVGANLVV